MYVQDKEYQLKMYKVAATVNKSFTGHCQQMEWQLILGSSDQQVPSSF